MDKFINIKFGTAVVGTASKWGVRNQLNVTHHDSCAGKSGTDINNVEGRYWVSLSWKNYFAHLFVQYFSCILSNIASRP